MAIWGIQKYRNTTSGIQKYRNTTSPSYDGRSKHEGGTEKSGNMGNTEI